MHCFVAEKLVQSRAGMLIGVLSCREKPLFWPNLTKNSWPNPQLRKKDLSAKPGYYIHCRRQTDGSWQRQQPLPRPDARFGFPWTVKDWEKRRKADRWRLTVGGVKENVEMSEAVGCWKPPNWTRWFARWLRIGTQTDGEEEHWVEVFSAKTISKNSENPTITTISLQATSNEAQPMWWRMMIQPDQTRSLGEALALRSQMVRSQMVRLAAKLQGGSRPIHR